jgi:CubicO group peptidase (beta-lactamase class C family)
LKRALAGSRPDLLSLIFFGLCVTTGPSLTQERSKEEAEKAIQDVALAAVGKGFAGQILAVRDGGVLFHEAFGEASPGVPTELGTVYAIGSVTKDFTRAAILKLEEQGRLSTGDPVSRYIPDLPADKQAITLDQLLSMQAGLHEYHDESGDHQPMTKAEALERVGNQNLLFEPGTQRAYSNSGYTLLAAVVEAASAQTFEEYVRDELMIPAGMETGGFHGEDRWPDQRVARGRNMRVHGDNAPNHWPFPTWALKGGGGMVASTTDLLAWVQSSRAGKVMGPEATAKQYPASRNEAVYAGGDDFGFQTGVIEMNAGRDLVIINTNTGTESVALAGRVAQAMMGEALPDGIRRIVEEDRGGEEDREGDQPGVVRETVGGVPGQIPDSPRARMGMVFTRALEDGSPEALQPLVEEHFSEEMLNAFTMEEHLEQISRLSEIARAASDVRVSPGGPFTVQLHYSGWGTRTVVIVDVQESPPHKVVGVRVEERQGT